MSDNDNNEKADKITLWNKIFSFSEASIEKYLKEAIWEYYYKVDRKKDFIIKDSLFLLKTTWHSFVWLAFFIWLILYFSFFYMDLLVEINEKWVSLPIFGLSIAFIVMFIYFWIKANFVNLFSIIASIILISINIYSTKDALLTVDWISRFMLNTAFIIFIIFLIEITFKFIKAIYDKFVDYKNDFIVIYPKWIYYSNKNWVLSHSHTRVEFDKITNIEAKQEWILSSFFSYWVLKISTMWTMDDIVFEHCENFAEVSKRLDNTRLDYISRKHKWEIWELEAKPFESSLRDNLLKVLSTSWL